MITPEQLAKSGTEHSQQVALFAWTALNVKQYPMLRWMHAIPNGGFRTKAEAGRLKAEGVKAGVADVFLPCRSGNWTRPCVEYYMKSGLYIEMKTDKGRVSTEQVEFGKFVESQNFSFIVCYSWIEARDAIIAYLS